MKGNKGKVIALAAGAGVLLTAALAIWRWEDVRAWYVGYRFIATGEGIFPASINASGQAAVNRRLGNETEAGRWTPGGGFLSLGTLPDGEPRTRATVINDRGSIIGSVHRGGDHLARAFLWSEEEGMRELETLGGQQIAPIDLNNKDQVVGWSHPPGRGNPWRAFLWSPDDGIKDLGALAGGGESQALAINDAGWVAGHVGMRPFLWRPESVVKEITPGSGFMGGVARDVNDRGEVLVTLTRPGPTVGNMGYVLGTPFLWTEEGGLVNLPVPGGYDDVQGVSINNRGVVLLRASKRPGSEGAGFLVSRGELTRLPDVLEGGLTYYHDINDLGWLAGGVEPRGNEGRMLTRGFIARPVR